jgi:hypothetical protein
MAAAATPTYPTYAVCLAAFGDSVAEGDEDDPDAPGFSTSKAPVFTPEEVGEGDPEEPEEAALDEEVGSALDLTRVSTRLCHKVVEV